MGNYIWNSSGLDINVSTMEQLTGKIMTVEIRGEAPKGAGPPKSVGAHNDFRIFRCEDILEYLFTVEEYFGQKYDGHHQWVERNKLIIKENDDAASFAVDEYNRWGAALPSVMRASVFAYAYGRLEHCLHTLCKTIQEALPIQRGPEDLKKDNGFIRSRKYLEKYGKIVWSTKEQEGITTVEIFGIIRNAIMHTNCILKIPQKEIERKTQDYVLSTEGIGLDKSRTLVFDGGFVQQSVQQMEEVWKMIERRAQEAVAIEPRRGGDLKT